MHKNMRFVLYGLLLALLVACSASFSTRHAVDTPPSAQISSDENKGEVFVGAGDIAGCWFNAAERTAQLLDTIPGTVFTAGDNVYDSGTAREFRDCYELTWGRHKSRTRPTPGNHDYLTKNAAPYYEYFGASAGPSGRGYYSYELGSWHIIALNSNIDAGEGSTQMEWLRRDLLTDKHKCTLAYWHHPVFSSGKHGNNMHMRAIFDELFSRGVEVVISGHEHMYERLAPMDGAGVPDPLGIRSFIVGTGGAMLTGSGKTHPSSEVRQSAYGVLKLTLKKGSYDWQFVPVSDDVVGDRGSGTCH